jgi:hypothetical protein
MPTARLGLGLPLALLLATACSGDRPTEPGPQTVSKPAFLEACSSSCLQDNFTDADGTSLGSHAPDGGNIPFAWQLTGSNPTPAQIQSNAVGFDESAGWMYLTSVNAGSSAEVEVDVFADVTLHPVQTDVAIILGADPERPTFYKGYAVYWLIYGDGLGYGVAIDRLDDNLLFQDNSTAAPTSVGIHKFRAELTGDGVINAYVDDVLVATVTDPDPLPVGRAGMSFFNGGTPSSVRITSFAASPPPPQGSAIQVVCSPESPVRGTQVTCTASLTPGAGTELAVSKWTFFGLAVPATIVENTSSTTWSGLAGFGGGVSVEGTVDGVAKTGHGNFTVTERDWSQMKAVHVAHEETSTLPVHPTEAADLGVTRSFTFGFTTPDRIALIASGPNQGWYYATAMPIRDSSAIQINRAALAKNSDFYKRHANKAQGDICPRSEVTAFLPKAIAHEGVNLEVNSHAWAYGNALDQTVGDLVEGALGATPEDLAASARNAAGPAIDDANEASARVDIDHPIPTLNNCVFNYY